MCCIRARRARNDAICWRIYTHGARYTRENNDDLTEMHFDATYLLLNGGALCGREEDALRFEMSLGVLITAHNEM